MPTAIDDRSNILRFINNEIPTRGYTFELIYDPLPLEDGGAKPGTKYSKTEMEYGAVYGAVYRGQIYRAAGSHYIVTEHWEGERKKLRTVLKSIRKKFVDLVIDGESFEHFL